jgi:transcription-repair coupling factor (superfamily II helicase)
VPELGAMENGGGRESFLKFLPEKTVLVVNDITYLCEKIEQTYAEGFSRQALEEHKATEEKHGISLLTSESYLIAPKDFQKQILDFCRIECRSQASCPTADKSLSSPLNISFHTHPQPVFHKNFDLLISSFKKLQDDNVELYVLADSKKQTDRLESIFSDKETGIRFTPVEKALHSGFFDDDLQVAIFTDHQIFDRYHKYSLRSEKAMGGKVALTLKELQQFEIGDYVVHMDYGVGRFGGLVRMKNGEQTQEVIKIIYSGDDTVYVSIHSLHKVSKYKGQEGKPPRISHLGTGAWDRMKERTKK